MTEEELANNRETVKLTAIKAGDTFVYLEMLFYCFDSDSSVAHCVILCPTNIGTVSRYRAVEKNSKEYAIRIKKIDLIC